MSEPHEAGDPPREDARVDLEVVVVTTHAPTSRGWGGAVVSGVETAAVAASVFSRVILICSDANNGAPPVDRGQAQKATPAQLRLYRSRRAAKQGFGLGALPILWEHIGRADCVYISGIFTWPVTIAALIALIRRKPHVVSLHGGLLSTHISEIRRRRPLKALAYDLVVLPLVRAADRVKVSSDFEAREAALVVAPQKIVVVPNTFEIGSIPFAGDPPAGAGTHMVFVGRLELDKGIRAFIRVWTQVAGPSDRLSVVGGGVGDYADAVRAQASLDPRVAILGEIARAKVFETLAAGHVLVLPSGLEGALRENFGNVVVEALAVGRPALVRRGLAWDRLPDAGVGWTFDGDDQALGAVLSQILSARLAHAPGLAHRCRAYVEQNFSSASERAPLLALTRACLAGRRVSS
jgi:glycosyltransferase involved in cell wall biosynthesis